MSFSTSAANTAFKEAFTVPATAAVSAPVEFATSKDMYTSLGKLWAAGHRAVQELEGAERHVPATDSNLKDDVAGAVETTLEGLWAEHQPKIGGVGSVIIKRIAGTMRNTYEDSMRGATAHAAAAADRAAATPYGGIPTVRIHTPAKGEDAAVLTEGGEPDLIDALTERIKGMAGAGDTGERSADTKPGNGAAAEVGREAAVQPALARAADRLVRIGCPPLRVDRIGGTLAQHLLQSKDTFTAWVESKDLSGAQLREALSIARALDLATMHYGAKYLTSEPAEVQLRRLLSVVLAAKLGSYKLSQFLEEIPGDSALAEIPDSVLKTLSERLKLEMKLEQLATSK